MSEAVLLTGGTGTLGRLVGGQLVAAGCAVRVLSRNSYQRTGGLDYVRGDLATGAGVAEAVAGVGTVVHCAGSATGDEAKARILVQAAARAGSPHLVYISVVGAERIPVVSRVDRALFGYYAAKRAAELVVAGSGLPWTTLRATQFHELILTTAQQLSRLPVMPVVAGFRFQPVDSAEVATRLVELALGEPAGLVPDVAGPRIQPMGELLQSYARARGLRRRAVSVRLPGEAARAYRNGANLAPDRAVGRRSFEDFLAERLPERR